MRRHLCIAILLGTVSFFGTAGSAQSQGVYPPGAGVGPYPPGPAMGGSPTSDFSGMGPQGGAYPGYYQPYPSISPYEHEFNQIANRGGIWESESQNRISMPSRWKFRTEYVRMKAERGRKLLGNQDAPIYREQIATTLEDGGGGGGGGAVVVAAISRTMWMHSLTPASTCLIPFQQKSLIVPSFEGCD